MGPKGSSRRGVVLYSGGVVPYSARGGGLPRQQNEGGSDQLQRMDELMELMASLEPSLLVCRVAILSPAWTVSPTR
jgi:hypothetical protein